MLKARVLIGMGVSEDKHQVSQMVSRCLGLVRGPQNSESLIPRFGENVNVSTFG